MILSRIKNHVSKQDWMAIAIEFVIVVVGVLLAFQITAWAESRTERVQFNRQLSSVHAEMSENLERFLKSHTLIEAQFKDLSTLRKILANPEIKATEEQLDILLSASVGVHGVYPKHNALNVVLSSESFVVILDKVLIDEIEAWDAALVRLHRQQQDELNFRDGFQTPYIAQTLSLGSIFHHGAGSVAAGEIAPSRFKHNRFDLSQDLVLENILVARQLSARQDINSTLKLIEHTQKIIQLIGINKLNY